ncbi:hypothetical protein BASA81_002637 [Batrachochytrium salamandrivorans]|nr:hypothetical protein BASA81_002637 [Batrachochytrium salamandrivorans]
MNEAAFRLPLMYEAISTKARMQLSLRTTLQSFFSKLGKDYTKSFLRIASNNKSRTARSTTYVIEEGEINSPLCFSMSKYKADKTLWITPNGWKTATIACGSVFTCEACIRNERIEFRFARVNSELAFVEEFGEWDENLTLAFGSLEHLFSREMQVNLSKISKHLILAVYCIGVQRMLLQSWSALKRGLSPTQLIAAKAFEANPRRCELPQRGDAESKEKILPSASLPTGGEVETDGTTTKKKKPRLDLPQRTGLVSRVQVLNFFRKVDPSVEQQAVGELLRWLDAGRAVKLDLVVEFLNRVEDCVQDLWKQMQFRIPLDVCYAKCLGATAGVSPESYVSRFDCEFPAEVLACVFVFSKMTQAFPSIEAIYKERDCKEFLRKITHLPDLAAVHSCL